MATSSDQVNNSTDEYEETRTVCCSLCSGNGSYTPARHYCVDCELYLCGSCGKSHVRIPALKSHQVNDVDSSISTSGNGKTKEPDNLPTEALRCLIHEGKLIDTYCRDHDKVCCGTCALIKHRICITESIAEASQDFQSNPEPNKCKEALNQVLIQLKITKEKRTETIDRIGKQKLELIDAVDKYEDRIIAKIKELSNITRREIRSKYDEHKTILDIDAAALDAAIATTKTYINKLGGPGNEILMFATVKTSKRVTRDGEDLLQAMIKEWKDRKMRFHFDNTFENTVDKMKSLGVLEDDCTIIKYEATFQKKISIVRNNETNISLYDMCLIDSGDLLLTDYQNSKLKRHNLDLQFKDEIPLPGKPVAVCKIDERVVAVRINNKTVHFVSVGELMQLTSSFTLDDIGWGMTYDASTEEIFACEENKVSVYSKTGNKLRTYDKTTHGESMLSQCKQIVLNENNQDIYVTDYRGYMLVFDKIGNLKMKVNLSGFNHAWLLYRLPGNICLVGSQDSGKIIQIDEDGKQIGTLINTVHDIQSSTYCALYDRERSRLIVGGFPSVIYVYTMSAKRS